MISPAHNKHRHMFSNIWFTIGNRLLKPLECVVHTAQMDILLYFWFAGPRRDDGSCPLSMCGYSLSDCTPFISLFFSSLYRTLFSDALSLDFSRGVFSLLWGVFSHLSLAQVYVPSLSMVNHFDALPICDAWTSKYLYRQHILEILYHE